MEEDIKKQNNKVTIEDLDKLVKSTKDWNLLKKCLKYIFSFECNIGLFGKFFFPEEIQNNVPEFHEEWYQILNKQSNDALAAPRGHAKQLADSTPILTTEGWKTHGELEIGDYVFSPSGKPIMVIDVTKKTFSDYVITTRDKEQIRCSGEHEWKVFDRNKKKWIILETKDMLGNWKSKGQRSRYQLPLREPLVFPYRNLELDPYFLGLWLGDGSSTKSCITHDKNDKKSISAIPYKISAQYIHKDTGVYTTCFNHQDIRTKLRKLNIFGNKRIPEQYFQSSLKQRLELMAGLIDSDGHVSKTRGRVRFSNINFNLIKDVERLAISLGSRPYIVLYPGGVKKYPGNNICKYKELYQLCFDPIVDIPTKLKRKKSKRKPIRHMLGITSVRNEPNGEFGSCIMVDSQDGLYLAGKRLIPTHNSTTTGLVYISWRIVNNLEKYIVYISQNHTKTVQFLEPLREHFNNNKMLIAVYGNMAPRGTSDDTGRDREDCIDINNIRVEAVSFEKNLRGFKYNGSRPTLIIGDDIEGDERVTNPESRKKDSKKLNRVIIPSLDIIGRFKFIGTLLHIDSLLMEKIRTYSGKVYTAFTDQARTEVLWKQRYTKQKLDEIRKDIGSVAFESEYMNNPIDNESSLIHKEWVEACFDENLSTFEARQLKFEYKVLGVDFAFSDQITADESAFVSVGLTKNEKKVIFQGSTMRGMSGPEQLEHIRDGLHVANRYDKIALEENSIKSISKNLQQYGLPLILYWTAGSDPANSLKPDIPFQYKRQTCGKINMVTRLSAAFERQDFVIPYKTEADKEFAHKLMAECCSWALSNGKLVEASVHPNIPIALGYANETLNDRTGGFSVAW